MDFKTEFTIKNVNLTGEEFVMQFETLLRSALHYTKMHLIHMHDRYYELKKKITPFRVETMTDDTREKIAQYEEEMRYYKEQIKELERLQAMEAKATTLNKKFEIMKMFNEWMLKG